MLRLCLTLLCCVFASSVFAADGAISRALPSSVDSNKSVTSSRMSNEEKVDVNRAGQSKNSRGVATREVPKVVAREGAKSNENSAGANARRGANADSDSRTTNARTQRSATATRSVANARGGATAAKSTATATASRVATTNVARTANRSVKSDVAKGVRASVTGLYTGFAPPPPKDVV